MSFQKYAPTLLSVMGNQKGYYQDINLSPVTPSDTVDLPNGTTRGLLAVTSGNIAVNLDGGGTATLTGLSTGQMLAIAVTRVLATGTTATVSAAYL